MYRAIAVALLLCVGCSGESPKSRRLKPGSFAFLRDGNESTVVLWLGKPHEIMPDTEAMEWIPSGTRVMVVSDEDANDFETVPDSRDVLVIVKEGPKSGITGHLSRKKVIPE